MKTLEQFEEELEEYREKRDVVQTYDDFCSFLKEDIEDLEDEQKSFEKELKINGRLRRRDKILDFIMFENDSRIDEYYQSDDDILESCIQFIDEMRNLYIRIYMIATKDNYRELIKFVGFSTNYYFYQLDYYDYLRDQLDLLFKGIQMYDPNYQDIREILLQFMDCKLNEFCNSECDGFSHTLIKKEG